MFGLVNSQFVFFEPLYAYRKHLSPSEYVSDVAEFLCSTYMDGWLGTVQRQTPGPEPLFEVTTNIYFCKL